MGEKPEGSITFPKCAHHLKEKSVARNVVVGAKDEPESRIRVPKSKPEGTSIGELAKVPGWKEARCDPPRFDSVELIATQTRLPSGQILTDAEVGSDHPNTFADFNLVGCERHLERKPIGISEEIKSKGGKKTLAPKDCAVYLITALERTTW